MENLKKRHGFLLAWLIISIVAISATIIEYLLMLFNVKIIGGNLPVWAIYLYVILNLFNLLCLIAILKWRKWGFWGICISAVILFGLNLIRGNGILYSFLGVTGVIILFAVLHFGKEDKAWSQLE
jgi:hypothetical protein